MHGLIVGPTENPARFPALFNNTLLTKKDLPVRYFPTMEITASLREGSNEAKNFSASGFS